MCVCACACVCCVCACVCVCCVRGCVCVCVHVCVLCVHVCACACVCVCMCVCVCVCVYFAFCDDFQVSVQKDRFPKCSMQCKVYQACVLSVLLYGSECWTPLKKDLKKLDSFHNRCVRTILGITNKQQWSQRITSLEIRQRWGDPETATVK